VSPWERFLRACTGRQIPKPQITGWYPQDVPRSYPIQSAFEIARAERIMAGERWHHEHRIALAEIRAAIERYQCSPAGSLSAQLKDVLEREIEQARIRSQRVASENQTARQFAVQADPAEVQQVIASWQRGEWPWAD
jgi:hypothetical protein